MLEIAPNSNEVEVSLIGTGGGYGESIVLKLSKNDWIIIDSCINPKNKKPLPLEYLESINVHPENIKLIICTHWHDDHIKGLSNILYKSENTSFVTSLVRDLKQFLLFISLDHQKSIKGGMRSTEEFGKCLQILNDRNKKIDYAIYNQLLYRNIEDKYTFELYSLSPSPKTIDDFQGEISTLIDNYGKRSFRPTYNSPNEKSVALLLKFNDQRIILGSDLEIGNNEEQGWLHIIKNSLVFDNEKAKIFKLPHHGSQNGYHKDLFDKYIDSNPILKLTPWNKNTILPTAEMIKIYNQHSNDIYITSKIISNSKPKKKDKSIEKIIKRFSISLNEVKYNKGIIRSRIDYTNPESNWNTEIFESAIKI
ncbi:MBL fold metallo-hydrolase [Flavobacterium beibuense]|uniref:Metallo-beta-lactamase domain protein n=1 Tax=Flavobacterium beibuense TaxID=657326 RepID=A0A444WF91_9FLAO|nr:MBL fold metallo-hydrolase [Flavobacterium beibuense]RYJ44521.1 Metallo-beta-lactamase domain protein [Flavobacterium beibuense]